MIESPQISSGLGTLWGKLASNTDDKNLRFDFFCPNPDICSPFGKSGIEVPGKLYYANNPPLSWFLSVKRNANRGIIRLFWSVLYLPFVIVQKYIISSSEDIYLKWFSEQIEEKLPKILESENYDAIACHVPPFEICQSVLNIATSLNIPYVHIVGDPIGFRDDKGGFTPKDKDIQQEILDRASVFVTTKETYQRYYSQVFNIHPQKVAFFHDCYLNSDCNKLGTPVNGQITIMHWGSVAPWRPIDKFVSALDRYNKNQNHQTLNFTIVGKVHDKKQKQILQNAQTKITFMDLMPYEKAREVAQTADFFMVAVSARHMDNIPSKLVDLMTFKKPVLLLAHPDSEASKEIIRLGIGVSAHPDNDNDIFQAINNLVINKSTFVEEYTDDFLLQSWSCPSVAQTFCHNLFQAMKW